MSSLAAFAFACCLAAGALAADLPEFLSRYEAALEGPGGEVRFGIRIEQASQLNPRAWITNGEESISVPVITLAENQVSLDFDYYDSVITATVSPDGETMQGTWKKRRGPDQWVTMPFKAKTEAPRTADIRHVPPAILGRWRVKFASDEDPAVAIFGGEDQRDLSATFLTTTGDYRFLDGHIEPDTVLEHHKLEVSCFDGSHAFLFKAQLQPDGSLKGDFWSGSSHHDTWTAVRDDDAKLPDPFGLTKFTGTAAQLDALAFPDSSGAMHALGEYAGSARIIEIFGTWCPNCRDATHVLVELDKQYRDRGLKIIGLAFEVTGDAARDRAQVKLYAERHKVEYPMLIAGRNDKAEASRAFPVIDKVRAYPTFLFIDAKGKVRGVYTGFSGPATGEEHERLKKAFAERVEEMLED